MTSNKKQEWKMERGCLISVQPVVPGIWQRKEGGHYIRARVVNPTTGRLTDIRKMLPSADLAMAIRLLDTQKALVKAGESSAETPKQRFAVYAASLFERKVKTREIRSVAGRSKWAITLEHLIVGSTGRKSKKHVAAFGDFFLDRLTARHVEEWRASVGELIVAGDFAPTTCNGWLAILRVILKAAKRELALDQLTLEGIADFDESEHEIYTEEEPNTLLPEEVPTFMAAMRELYPQHYAMVYLGLVTGLRPSSLRPLRRGGATPDVLWDACQLLVRRSHTRGQEVMNTTKQRVKYRIHLPAEAIAVLRWHVETQLSTPEQQESELLFPALHGGYRTASVLNKPFADVVDHIQLGRKFTQRGMRRTFNDLTRAAKVEAIVTRSISGHLTERMQERYSTVAPIEQRESIAKVIDFMSAKQASAKHSTVSRSTDTHDETPAPESGTVSGTPEPTTGTTDEQADRTRTDPKADLPINVTTIGEA